MTTKVWKGLIGGVPLGIAAVMAVRTVTGSRQTETDDNKPVRIEKRRRPDRWKGFVTGMVGSAMGEMATMRYWQAVTENRGGQDPRRFRAVNPKPDTLDDISLTGLHYEQGEPPTSAMGRMLYERITGRQPSSPEIRTAMSYLMRWLMGGLWGALYGVTRARGPLLDVRGGLTLGTASWLLGDEMGPSLMGFSGGPTAYPVEMQAYGLGAHLVHGMVTALSTQLLRRLLP